MHVDDPLKTALLEEAAVQRRLEAGEGAPAPPTLQRRMLARCDPDAHRQRPFRYILHTSTVSQSCHLKMPKGDALPPVSFGSRSEHTTSHLHQWIGRVKSSHCAFGQRVNTKHRFACKAVQGVLRLQGHAGQVHAEAAQSSAMHLRSAAASCQVEVPWQ